MAHLVETMAYAGEVPWHGLGVPVSNDLTPTQMMQKAELELKQAKFAHDKAMDEAELQLKSKEATAKDQRENKRIDSQSEIAGAKIALDSVEEAQKLQERKEEREKQDFMEGVNIAERAIDKTNQ